MKHTPTPWTYARVKTSSGYCFKIGSPEQVSNPHGPICIYDDSTSLNPRVPGQAEADAKRIVESVNTHDALVRVAVEARKFIMARVGGESPSMSELAKSLDDLETIESK